MVMSQQTGNFSSKALYAHCLFNCSDINNPINLHPFSWDSGKMPQQDVLFVIVQQHKWEADSELKFE